MKNTAKKFAIGALLAGVVGYIAGLLTAPKSGKETREDIKETASNAISAAEKELKALHTQLNDVIDKVKLQAAKVNGKTREQLESALAKAGIAKEKARELLSAVHEGDAEDKDLKNAIQEAAKAIQNLKTYLTK